MIDVEPGTVNVDHAGLEAAITNKTRAILAVHYAGIACGMDNIMAIVRETIPRLSKMQRRKRKSSVLLVTSATSASPRRRTSPLEGRAAPL